MRGVLVIGKNAAIGMNVAAKMLGTIASDQFEMIEVGSGVIEAGVDTYRNPLDSGKGPNRDARPVTSPGRSPFSSTNIILP